MIGQPTPHDHPRARRRVARSDTYRQLESEVRARILGLLGRRSIASLSEDLGLNRESVRRALRHGRIPLEMVVRVCGHFGVSADWLLFGPEDRARSDLAANLRVDRQEALVSAGHDAQEDRSLQPEVLGLPRRGGMVASVHQAARAGPGAEAD